MTDKGVSNWGGAVKRMNLGKNAKNLKIRACILEIPDVYYEIVSDAWAQRSNQRRWADKKLWKKLRKQLDKSSKTCYIMQPFISLEFAPVEKINEVLIKENLKKSLKHDLTKLKFSAILSNRQITGKVIEAVMLIKLEKVWKKYKTRLDKLKKLWYIKKPTIAVVIVSWLKIE